MGIRKERGFATFPRKRTLLVLRCGVSGCAQVVGGGGDPLSVVVDGVVLVEERKRGGEVAVDGVEGFDEAIVVSVGEANLL